MKDKSWILGFIVVSTLCSRFLSFSIQAFVTGVGGSAKKWNHHWRQTLMTWRQREWRDGRRWWRERDGRWCDREDVTVTARCRGGGRWWSGGEIGLWRQSDDGSDNGGIKDIVMKMTWLQWRRGGDGEGWSMRGVAAGVWARMGVTWATGWRWDDGERQQVDGGIRVRVWELGLEFLSDYDTMIQYHQRLREKEMRSMPHTLVYI